MPKFITFGKFGDAAVCRVHEDNFCVGSVYVGEGCYNQGLVPVVCMSFPLLSAMRILWWIA